MTGRRRQRPLLGTFVEIVTRADGPLADAAITKGFEVIAAIHELASFQDPDSQLSRLNRADGNAVALHPLLLRVLRLARGMTRASGGLFNCTLGGALIRKGVLPNHGARNVAEIGTSDDIEFSGAAVRLRNNVQVTLDGIAKGFAVDMAVRVMKRHGVKAGWINAGGDMRAFGDVSVPVMLRLLDDRLLPAGDLRNAAIATSRVAPKADERFPGIIVAAAGLAPELGIWSVMAAQAWRADALTKVAALSRPADREAVVRRLRGELVQPGVPIR
jgi:thiamine biosynthesis lipoprotein